MDNAIRRIQKRKKELITPSDLMGHSERVIVIHYSCQSFYNRPDGSFPRITSIAVRNLDSSQTKSYSIHQMAERNRVSNAEIEQNFDRLEKLRIPMKSSTDSYECRPVKSEAEMVR